MRYVYREGGGAVAVFCGWEGNRGSGVTMAPVAFFVVGYVHLYGLSGL